MLYPAQNTEQKTTNRLGRNRSKLWQYVGVLALVVLVAPVVSNIARFNLPAWARLHVFMEKMARKDFESAYSLYSPQAKAKMSVSDLEAMTHGSSSVLFDGYKGLFIQGFHLRAAYGPGLPEFMANIEGTMLYKSKSSRPFTATLVMINDRWVIESIQIDSLPSQP